MKQLKSYDFTEERCMHIQTPEQQQNSGLAMLCNISMYNKHSTQWIS